MSAIEPSLHSKLAKDAVVNFVKFNEIGELPNGLPAELLSKAAAFVCLKINNELRGCIGSLEPTYPSLAKEIQINAISAATKDPRFLPVGENELDEINYSVDVLKPPTEIQDISQLDPKKYGIIVESYGRRGVLLPDLEGVDTVEKQIQIAAKKAGIELDEKLKIKAFEVVRYH